VASPRDLLNDDEELVLALRPHWSALFKPALTLLAILLLAFALAGIQYTSVLRMVLAGIGFGWFAVRYLQWVKTQFIVTTERIMFRTGILAKHGIKIPMGRINGVSFSQSVMDRLMGTGDLAISVGGVPAPQSSFARIPHPASVQDTIYELMEAIGNKGKAPRPAPSAPGLGASLAYDSGDPTRSNPVVSDGVVLSPYDADALVDLLAVIERYARSDLLPEGMAEHIRGRFIEAGQMRMGDSVVRDMADALAGLGGRIRDLRARRRESS
jgi:membrane protein YdbS with pleckstrin-like domain